MVSEQVLAEVREPAATVIADNCIKRNGRIIRFSSDSAPQTSCILFGDSFSFAMLRYLAESFGQFTFVYLATVDRELVESEDADLIIFSRNERFLIRAPKDADAPSAAEVAADKRSKGEVLASGQAQGKSLKLLWP
jgi:hypothetical protein